MRLLLYPFDLIKLSCCYLGWSNGAITAATQPTTETSAAATAATPSETTAETGNIDATTPETGKQEESTGTSPFASIDIISVVATASPTSTAILALDATALHAGADSTEVVAGDSSAPAAIISSILLTADNVSEADPRPEVKLKKKVSFKESVTVQSAEDGRSTAEDLKGSPINSSNSSRGLSNSSTSQAEEEVTMVVDVANLGYKGAPSYVRHGLVQTTQCLTAQIIEEG